MKLKLIKPHKRSWECDLLPNVLVLRTGDRLKLAVSFLLWGVVFVFNLKENQLC